ncbi:IclR family transcriptional regulator domain-containing protein [Sodalis ligni]|uniref:IclR family transcriptional regulator domain-containing protein n=1 Tax=Sodalis ligni TaxID=2697027 RepID=UPI00104F2F6C
MNGTNQLEISLQLGSRFELNSVAQGRIVLAFGPSSLAERYLSMPLPFHTSRTITSPDKLREELALIRKRGWTDAPEELYVGINAF